MGFLSKHEMQPILLLQFYEWNGISNDLQNNVGQDLFVDIKNCWDHESRYYILEWSQVLGREGLKIILL